MLVLPVADGSVSRCLLFMHCNILTSVFHETRIPKTVLCIFCMKDYIVCERVSALTFLSYMWSALLYVYLYEGCLISNLTEGITMCLLILRKNKITLYVKHN